VVTLDISIGLTIHSKAGRKDALLNFARTMPEACKLVMYYATLIGWPCTIDRKGGAPS